MDNMVHFTPKPSVDPPLIQYHFDVNVYWNDSQSSEDLKDKIAKYFHGQ